MRVYYFRLSVRLSVVSFLLNLNTALIPFFERKLLKLDTQAEGVNILANVGGVLKGHICLKILLFCGCNDVILSDTLPVPIIFWFCHFFYFYCIKLQNNVLQCIYKSYVL